MDMDEAVPLLSSESADETEFKRQFETTNEQIENEEISYTPNDLPQGKKYHLFISCSSKDYSSIKPIIATLENLYSIKCMISERDFIPGKGIVQNIDDSMIQSMKILLAISPNYLKSCYCEYEKKIAFLISVEERRHCVIPLLLEHCPNMPSELKRLTYIDSGIQSDIPARIMDALWHNDSPKCLVPNEIPDDLLQYIDSESGGSKSSRNKNGSPLFFIYALKKTPSSVMGNQWKFKPLTDIEIEKMNKDNIVIGTFYSKLIADLNAKAFLKHYGALHGRMQLLVMIILITLMIMVLTVVVYFLQVLGTGVLKDFDSSILLFGGLLAFFVDIALPFGRKLLASYLLAGIHTCIWKHMKQYYKVGMFLLFYHEDNKMEPSLKLVKYDTEPCKKYVTTILRGKHSSKSPESLESLADSLIESFIQRERKRLYTWSTLPSCISERHNTYIRKKCLCQLLEDTSPICKSVENYVIEV